MTNLAYHRDLVDREACSFDIVEATPSRKKTEEEISKAEAERESSHLQAVLTWLCVDDLPQEDNLWRLKDKRSGGTCDWIFNTPQYQNWVKTVPKGPWLWLTGIPGSGKSPGPSSGTHFLSAYMNIPAPLRGSTKNGKVWRVTA